MNIQLEKNQITDFLNKNKNKLFKEQPIIEENLKLIKEVLQKIENIDKQNIDFYFHKLHRKGIIYLINNIKDNLNYIPTDILRNNLTPLNNYINISNKFSDIYKEINNNENNYLLNIFDKSNLFSEIYDRQLMEIFQNEYLQILHILNYFKDLEFNVLNNIQID